MFILHLNVHIRHFTDIIVQKVDGIVAEKKLYLVDSSPQLPEAIFDIGRECYTRGYHIVYCFKPTNRFVSVEVI